MTTSPGALDGIRVLDLAGPFGVFGTRMLADLGADVVKVEPPAGDVLRKRPPFADSATGDEGSLPFFLMNCNKRGVTLDLSTAAGQGLFRDLVASADVVVESFAPAHLDRLGIGYASFETELENLIWIAVTPFGQSGPYAAFQLSDLTAQAIGGALYLTGEKLERPVQGGGRVAEKIAGYMTALAAVTALHWRAHGGRGQYVDLSVHEAVVSQMESFTTKIFYSGEIYSREGRLYPRTYPAGLFPCRDGWVSLVAGPRHQWEALREWIGDARLLEPRYLELDERMRDRPYLDGILCDWTAQHEKRELFEEGQRRRIPVGISFTPREVVEDGHLLSRDYLSPIRHSALGEQLVPGRPFLAHATPWTLRRPAPTLGEHNEEVYGGLGMTPGAVRELRLQGAI